MFSIGDGAGTKFNVDITSEFALLPDASIRYEPAADALADLGHASSAYTPRPHAAPIDPSCDPAEFLDESMHDAEVSEAPEPPGATPDATLSAALTELNNLRDALKTALTYGAGTNAQDKKARLRKGSKRPSHILPEAWANMSNKQRAQAEVDIAAKRQIIRAQIESLLQNFPQLRSSPEGRQLSQEVDIGAAAQTTSSNFTGSVAINAFRKWIPNLRSGDPNFHYFTRPCDAEFSTAVQSISERARGPSPYIHESNESTYADILHDANCYRTVDSERTIHAWRNCHAATRKELSDDDSACWTTEYHTNNFL